LRVGLIAFFILTQIDLKLADCH